MDDEQEKTFMAQLNANGEPVWEKTIFDAPAKGVSAIPLKDGGYSVCFYKVTYDDYINKIDTNFVIIYNTQFEPVRTKRMKHFRFSKHIQTSDGGFLLIGSGKQQISLIGDVYTKKIMKLSADLDSLWAREITPDNSSHELGGAYHLSELPDGSFNVMMVANDTTSKKGLLFCARLSSDGIKQWEKTYPGFVSFDAIINSGSYPIAIEFPDFGVGFVTPIMHWDPYQYYGMYYRFNHDMDTIWKFKSMDHIEYNNGLALGNNSAILLKTDRTLCTIGYGTQPSVTITQPETGESFGVGEPVTIVAEVHNDSAKYVDYFSGTTLIGTDSTAPYSFSWTDAEPGIHNLTAVATCTSGVSVTSPVIIIAVSSVAVTNTLARFGPNKGLKIIPGNREITFSTHTINTHHIEVVTINGRCIRRYKGKGVQSHSAKLPAGMYFIRYTVSDNSVIHPVVVK